MMKTWEVPLNLLALGAPRARLVEAGYPGGILCPPDTPLPSSFLRTATMVVGRSVSARAASIDRSIARMLRAPTTSRDSTLLSYLCCIQMPQVREGSYLSSSSC